MTETDRGFGPASAIALTLGSALLWGTAHVATGRQRTGLMLMAVYVALLAVIITAVFGFGPQLFSLAVQPGWLTALMIALFVVALLWTTVIVWSYLLVRPDAGHVAGRTALAALTAGLCVLVIVPAIYAGRLAYVSKDVVNSLFTNSNPSPVVAQDPWNGAERVNFLLIGADAAPSRPGVRTDSMTVASVDTATGATVLFGLPRNLERVPLPAGPARQRFPYGFGGEPPYTPGLLNEIFQYAEDYPDMMPGVHKGQRGPRMLKQTISGILGINVDYYAMVDMAGFADIIDAMGGVRVTVKQPIVYGKYREGLLPAGRHRLSGEQALWFGRSRTDSDDYVRMGRQKCLMNAVAKQADPMTVLKSFEKLATATKRAISTDIPQDLLPAMIELSQKVKDTRIRSLSFVPPLISTAYPDWSLIRHRVQQALQQRPANKTATAPGSTRAGVQSPENPVALDAACG